MKNIKIKTPYGDKNWSFIKTCLDSHNDLLEACKLTLSTLAQTGSEPTMLIDVLNKAIAKAEGGAE